MIVRKGYDYAAAEAMRSAEGCASQGFHERCRAAHFWGLYDPEAVGAIVIEHNIIHVSSLRPCGFAVRKVLRDWNGQLLTVIREHNQRAQKLAVGMGFRLVQVRDGWKIYKR